MLDRAAIDTTPTDELEALGLRSQSLSDAAVMLMGFQRTKQIDNRARKAWNAGDTAPMAAEVSARRDDIIRGAFAEVWQEYLPMRDYLKAKGLTPTHVADVGSGSAVNDLFLDRDYAPRFTLIDIEETDEQYHGWNALGSGYASLDAAKALLVENGVAEDSVTLINPTRTPDAVAEVSPDLTTSLYSCGFHYPVDDYLELFERTLANGGAVVLDIRGNYWQRKPAPLARLCDAGEVTEIYHDIRSIRIGVSRA